MWCPGSGVVVASLLTFIWVNKPFIIVILVNLAISITLGEARKVGDIIHVLAMLPDYGRCTKLNKTPIMSFSNLILLRLSILHVHIATNVTMTLRPLSQT